MGSKVKQTATFIGLDMAWGQRNPTGAAVIRDGRLVAWRHDLFTLEEIVDFVAAHLSPDSGSIVAVDAPLKVPNEHGSRACDRSLNEEWARFQAGAHPANRRLLARTGVVRGEMLVEMLTQRYRFIESANIPRRTNDRLVCEIYPHPAHISLFGLEKTLKYKRGRVASRRLELKRYQQYLRLLHKAKPSLKKTKRLLEETDVFTLRGKALKAYEDVLDALSCAYIAYYLWWHGPLRARTYGTVSDGHIIVPITAEMEKRS
jgi:predicted RNase H-like nuclease